MSKNMRSGLSAPISLTASRPFSDSPTTSMSGCAPKYSRIKRRANASSSTINTRMGWVSNCISTLFAYGNHDFHRKFFGNTRPQHARPIAIQRSQSTLDIAQAHARTFAAGLVGVHGVFYDHVQPTLAHPGPQCDAAALRHISYAMLDRVLHTGL